MERDKGLAQFLPLLLRNAPPGLLKMRLPGL